VRFADLAATHLAYSAASMTVTAGIMSTGADSTFQPARAVTGAEGVQAVARIAALAGPAATAGGAGNGAR